MDAGQGSCEVAETDTWQRKSRPRGESRLPICSLKPCPVVTSRSSTSSSKILAHYSPHFCNELMKMTDPLSACLKLPNSLFNFDPYSN
jgi:hypothetical protein